MIFHKNLLYKNWVPKTEGVNRPRGETDLKLNQAQFNTSFQTEAQIGQQDKQIPHPVAAGRDAKLTRV